MSIMPPKNSLKFPDLRKKTANPGVQNRERELPIVVYGWRKIEGE